MKQLLIVFVLVLTSRGFAQSITISDLKKVVDLPSLASAKQFIEAKGFKFYKDYDSKIEGVITKSWAYGYNAKTDEAVAWFSVSCDGDKPIRTYYEVFDFSLITPLSLGIFENKYTFENIEETDEEFIKRYSAGNYYVYEYQDKDVAKGSQFECIKKLTKADPMNGTSVKRYDDGSIKMTNEVVNGKLNGAHKEYSPSGVLIVSGNYKDDKEEGVFYYYDDNGVLDFSETYRYGKLEGDYIIYYPSGAPNKKFNYSYGSRSGKAFEYNEEGDVITEMNYINNKKFGLYKEFTNGEETFSGFYTSDSLNGLFNQKLFNSKGEVYATMSGLYKNDQLEGSIVAYYLGTRDTMSYRTYKNGYPTGKWRYLSKEKKLEKFIDFKDGKSGLCLYYNVQGEITDSLIYQGVSGTNWKFMYSSDAAGQRIRINYLVPISKLEPNTSIFRILEEKTQLYDATSYLNTSYKDGAYYYENEALILKGKFENDVRVGSWSRFYKDQKVQAILTYDENNQVVTELFTNKKGKPFSGKLTMTYDDTAYLITVSKGVRNGITSETNLETKEVLEYLYNNGEYVPTER